MSAFFLTHIKNPKDVELFFYEYQKDNRYINGTSVLLYQSCKLKKINSYGLGNIKIDYNFNATLETTMNDAYSISTITTENIYGRTVSQYSFEYNHTLFTGKNIRVLSKIKKSDLSNLSAPPIETTKFEYHTLPTSIDDSLPSAGFYCNAGFIHTPYPNDAVVGILKKIINPSGGITEYVFEPNEYFFDKNDPSYLASLSEYVDPTIQYISYNSYFDFNTANGNLAMWNLSGDPTKKKKIYIHFSAAKNPPSGGPDLDPGDGQSPLATSFKIDGVSYGYGCNAESTPTSKAFTASMELYPGHHSFEILGWNVSGSISISELITTPPPYKNIAYGHGIRIKDIKTLVSATDPNPVTISYKYNLFDNTNSSSGNKFYNESFNNLGEYILYKNVQVSNANNEQGYLRYIYKTPADYPDTSEQINGSYYNVKHFLNITNGGLIDEKKAYDISNQVVNKTKYDYVLEDMNAGNSILSSLGYIRTGVIKNLLQTETSYLNNTPVLTNIKEMEFANFKGSFQLAKIKTTAHDGDISEKMFTYASHLALEGQTNEYASLWNANMRGIPVNIIEKRNGKTISSIDLKFANDSLYPTSVVSNNPNDNTAKTLIKYDVYDERGNVVQYTTNSDSNPGSGFPTTIIYGYNKTLPILKAEGATWNDVKFIPMPFDWVGLDVRSNQDINDNSEKLLLKALDEFRIQPGLKNFIITTYTYDPLIGNTTVTGPNGMREVYKYDPNNRLKYVLDVNGNIMQDLKYNIKPQP